MSNISERTLHALQERIETLARNMEKTKIDEYVCLMQSPWRLVWINFVSGVSRGVGIGVGFALLGAFVVYILKSLVTVPIIGNYIAEIVEIVQIRLGTY